MYEKNPGGEIEKEASKAPQPTPHPLHLGTLTILPRGKRPPLLELTFRCDHCRTNHVHSWGLNAPKPTHRGAHCSRPNSPYRTTGYYIFPASTPSNAQVLARFAELTRDHSS